MADTPPERVTFSIPPDEDLDKKEIDELVEASPFDTRSEFIRAAIRGDLDPDFA